MRPLCLLLLSLVVVLRQNNGNASSELEGRLYIFLRPSKYAFITTVLALQMCRLWSFIQHLLFSKWERSI